MDQHKLIHLYNRFGFGLNAREIQNLSGKSFEEKLSSEKVELLDIDLSFLENIEPKKLSEKEKRELRKESRKKVADLNVSWLEKMIRTDNVIRERMTLFWHHHFACIIKNPRYGLQFTNTIRQQALGDFRTLLTEVSKSAAMINFLHTKQNKKSHPNEDFARELCELFTLGRDNEYTEHDIKEIARCFTGWNHRFDGTFHIRRQQHDLGNKTVFGSTGNFGGEGVIDLILQKRACAYFICENIYKYFVHPTPNKVHVEELASIFYQSDYDIQKLILHIANADWFYTPENKLAKIKSPIELMVMLSRQFNIQSENSKSWIFIQKIFDQVLFAPPNVKGWKVNTEWIDSNSLPLRLRLPSIILTNSELNISLKPDYDKDPNDGQHKNKLSKRLDFTFSWEHFFENNQGVSYVDLFFNGQLSEQTKEFLDNRTYDSEMEEVIQLISLPEYQLI